MDRTKLAILGELVTFAGNQHAWNRRVTQGIYISILEVSNQARDFRYRRNSTTTENFQLRQSRKNRGGRVF